MGVVGMSYLVFGLEIREEITEAIRVADTLQWRIVPEDSVGSKFLRLQTFE